MNYSSLKSRLLGVLLLPVAALVVSGCVDEKIVYRDKPLFEDPPQAAVGFLGYSNTELQKTACGNCHNGQQVKWVESKHASAWADLQANSHKAESCEGCHTTNDKGNAATPDVKVAYAATKDSRYQDVQCESCHGAGLEHVNDPSTTKPLASVDAGVEKTDGCGECHSGSHNPFVEEWEGSGHGEMNEVVKEEYLATPSSYTSCLDCHEGKTAMKNTFKVASNYAEKEDGNLHGITCAVCHDPHGNSNTAQLRMEASAHDGASNLCYQCHRRRPIPTGATTRNSPHSPQGPMVLGETVGWLPPGFTTDKIIGTHGSETNKGLCATCHVASYALTSSKNTVGHTFQAIPCKADDGTFSGNDDCTMSQRSFKSCLGSGCHGSEVAARSALAAAESRLTNMSAELKRLVAAARLTTKGAAEWKNDTNVSAVEGADFNSQIMEHDLSRGAHNPFYMDALLNASASYLKTYYGVQ